MNRTQPSNGALTSLESALAGLLEGLVAVAPISVPLGEAAGLVAAEMPAVAAPLPAYNRATIDGWALRSLDLAGASSYSPVPLSGAPEWVETGDPLPESCDCVIEADLVECHGPLAQALAEAVPGEGVRRAGEEVAAGRPSVISGRSLSAADLLVARAVGLDKIAVRSPRLRLIDVASNDGSTLTASLVAELAGAAGARVTTATISREAEAIAKILDAAPCDLIVLIGGTGFGRTDATIAALSMRGALIAHGIALQPGRTAATGRLAATPIVALPGAPDQAFSAYHMLVQPLLDRLCGRLARPGAVLPLARKISSGIGLTEIALVRQEQSGWLPLAVGALSLDHIRMADAWLAIPGGSEGYPAGMPVEAFPLRAS
jgi:molybdopterin biosynthesis enzyme